MFKVASIVLLWYWFHRSDKIDQEAHIKTKAGTNNNYRSHTCFLHTISVKTGHRK
jgi:hypothetical protein